MIQNKRRQKLIQPALQMRLILTFLGVALIGLVLQFILFAATVSALAEELPQDGPLLLERIPSYTLAVLGITVCVVLPLTITVGILTTFRIAGPLYRFDQHLKAVARGEDPGECRIRKGDQLQEFCATLNAALRAARTRSSAVSETPDESKERALDRAA
jgi:hypothetical protein